MAFEKLHNYHEGSGWVSAATYLAGMGVAGLAEAWMIHQPLYMHTQVDANLFEAAKAGTFLLGVSSGLATPFTIAASHESSYNPTSTYLSTFGRRTGYFASGVLLTVGLSALISGMAHSTMLPNVQY